MRLPKCVEHPADTMVSLHANLYLCPNCCRVVKNENGQLVELNASRIVREERYWQEYLLDRVANLVQTLQAADHRFRREIAERTFAHRIDATRTMIEGMRSLQDAAHVQQIELEHLRQAHRRENQQWYAGLREQEHERKRRLQADRHQFRLALELFRSQPRHRRSLLAKWIAAKRAHTREHAMLRATAAALVENDPDLIELREYGDVLSTHLDDRLREQRWLSAKLEAEKRERWQELKRSALEVPFVWVLDRTAALLRLLEPAMWTYIAVVSFSFPVLLLGLGVGRVLDAALGFMGVTQVCAEGLAVVWHLDSEGTLGAVIARGWVLLTIPLVLYYALRAGVLAGRIWFRRPGVWNLIDGIFTHGIATAVTNLVSQPARQTVINLDTVPLASEEALDRLSSAVKHLQARINETATKRDELTSTLLEKATGVVDDTLATARAQLDELQQSLQPSELLIGEQLEKWL